MFISAIAASYYAVKEVLLIPSPIKTQDLRRFSENRVINLLDELTKEEEIDLNLFLDRLNVIKSVAEEHYINQFKMFIHEGTSCIGTEVECFKKSGNIVTLIKSKYPASNVFLIHCGFSIGTSEFNKGNPIPCLMLMDTLQTFVFGNRTIYNDILFSFNILGEPYKDDSFAYLIKEFNVNAVVNLTGTDGREVLISEKPNSLASIYLDNAEYAPANSLVEGIFTSGKSRESNESDFISLEIFYPPSTKDFEQVMKHGKSGLIQRAGENLFSFIFALSQIQDIYHRQLELFSRTYFPSFENHGFPILRYKSHSLYSIPGAVAELIGFIVVLLIIIGLFAVGYFRICNQRQLVFTQVLTYYGISIGCVLFTNVALYLFSGLFNYIPFIPWDNGIIFLRNTLLHFVLSMAIFFKMSESIETKYLIDYEQIYFTFGIFAPLILLAIVSSTIYVHRIGYYFLIVTIPLIVVTYYVRKPILGFSRTHACPKIIPIILVFTLLPTIVLTTDTVISIFQSVRFAERENCNFVYSAILGLLPAFLLVSCNIFELLLNLIL